MSSLCLVKFGVLQGMLIPPILFNIQLNCIHLLTFNCQIIWYADDIVMLYSGDPWEEIFNIIKKKIKN